MLQKLAFESSDVVKHGISRANNFVLYAFMALFAISYPLGYVKFCLFLVCCLILYTANSCVDVIFKEERSR
jgi:hypothetical protein